MNSLASSPSIRVEFITDKTGFHCPFEEKRCKISADGFYGWQATPTGKQSCRFTIKDGGFCCMVSL